MTKIYHYTDANALKSVLENKKLWCSDIRYLNDHSEYKEGEEKITNYFKDRCHGNGAHKGLSPQNCKKVIEHFSSYLSSSKDSYTMICSFSTEGDLLSQWRGYCPNEGGYCLEYEVPYQEKFHDSLHQCIYDDEEKTRQTGTLFRLAKKAILKGHKREKGKAFRTTWSNIARFKNSGFSEEKEHRIIAFRNKESEEVKFRTRNNLIIPYIEIDAKLHLLRSIWIGPCQNMELAEESLKSFLRHLARDPNHPFYINGVPEIKKSSTTYRG